jgi:toxin ParE1/3/4
MMTARLSLSSQARSDLHEIWMYVAIESGDPGRAKAFLRRIGGTLDVLRTNPRLGRKRPEIGRDLRSFPIDDYLIVYQAGGGEVRVVRIVHGRLDLAALFPPESQ